MHDCRSVEDIHCEVNAAACEVCRCLKTGQSPAQRLGSACSQSYSFELSRQVSVASASAVHTLMPAD